MRVRTTIETIDESGAVTSVSSHTVTESAAFSAGETALGESVAVALRGMLGQWSGNVPDAWVYHALLNNTDTSWGEVLASLIQKWMDRDDNLCLNDFLEERLKPCAAEEVPA